MLLPWHPAALWGLHGVGIALGLGALQTESTHPIHGEVCELTVTENCFPIQSMRSPRFTFVKLFLT